MPTLVDFRDSSVNPILDYGPGTPGVKPLEGFRTNVWKPVGSNPAASNRVFFFSFFLTISRASDCDHKKYLHMLDGINYQVLIGQIL